MNWISLCRPAHCIGALPVCCKGTAARCLTYALTRQPAALQTCSSDSFLLFSKFLQLRSTFSKKFLASVRTPGPSALPTIGPAVTPHSYIIL